VNLNIIKVLSPTDAQENCFTRSIKIYIKTAPTCFGVITIIMMDVVRHTVPDNVHQLHVKQPSTYEKPEAASAVLGSW
jgi:hypothetical protein